MIFPLLAVCDWSSICLIPKRYRPACCTVWVVLIDSCGSKELWPMSPEFTNLQAVDTLKLMGAIHVSHLTFSHHPHPYFVCLQPWKYLKIETHAKKTNYCHNVLSLVTKLRAWLLSSLSFTYSLGSLYVYSIYLEPQWPLFFEGQPPKKRPFPTKTRVIWVPGI